MAREKSMNKKFGERFSMRFFLLDQEPYEISGPAQILPLNSYRRKPKAGPETTFLVGYVTAVRALPFLPAGWGGP